jgi:precorrin-6A/cobalt-precorrin-6A reductase
VVRTFIYGYWTVWPIINKINVPVTFPAFRPILAIFFGRAVVKKRILLLSGTSEGPPLARALLAAGFEVRATVTRDEARENLFGPLNGEVRVEARGFTEESLTAFLGQHEADLVLDATHPFAVRITRIAHAVCLRLGVPYVRFERPDWEPPRGTHLVNTFAAAAETLPSLGSRVLLTIGAKQLKHFAHLQGGMHLVARILPSVLSLQQALAAGFTPDRLQCLRPPFSRAFNRAILEEYRIDLLVTKASGREGGVEEKVLAAADLGVKVLMICRPEQVSPTDVSTIEAAVQACCEKAAGR